MNPIKVKLALFAALTVGLYSAFFLLIDPLTELYTEGTVVGAVAVVATALLFSAIHGVFASYLLEVIGLRSPKR